MTDLSQIQKHFAKGWDFVQELLHEAVQGSGLLLTALNRYLLQQPGKQLRPLLALLAAECWGTPNRASYLNAAMAEVIHNSSLLHDDVADEADLRRGRTSIQKEFGRGTSILLGDYYLLSALDTLVQAGCQDYLFAYVSAMRRMCEGEIFQLQKADSLDTVREDYDYIIYGKTAVLFETAMRMGARSTGATPEQEALIADIARHFGMAFQMRDDILDYRPFGSTGKPAGQDLTEGKITLPLLCAVANAGIAIDDDRMRSWLLAAKKRDKESIARVCTFVDENDGFTAAQAVLQEECARAREKIGKIPQGQAAAYLLDLANLLEIRNV